MIIKSHRVPASYLPDPLTPHSTTTQNTKKKAVGRKSVQIGSPKPLGWHVFSVIKSLHNHANSLTLLIKKIISLFRHIPFIGSYLERLGVFHNEQTAEDLRRAAMYGAEHLVSSKPFAGLYPDNSRFLEHLSNSRVPEIRSLAPLFQGLDNDEGIILSLRKMPKNSKIVFPLIRSSHDPELEHAMAAVFEKNKRGKINITIINTGDGIDAHHNKVVKNGCPKYNLARSYLDISIEDLEKSGLFSHIQSEDSIEDMYRGLESLPHREGPVYPNKARYRQLGANCVIASQMETLRYLLCDCAPNRAAYAKGKEAYKRFKYEIRYREFKELKNKLSSFSNKIARRANIILLATAQKLIKNKKYNPEYASTRHELYVSNLPQGSAIESAHPLEAALKSQNTTKIKQCVKQLKRELDRSKTGKELGKKLLSIVNSLFDDEALLFRSEMFTNPKHLKIIYQQLFENVSLLPSFRSLPDEEKEQIDEFRQFVLLILKKTKAIK